MLNRDATENERDLVLAISLVAQAAITVGIVWQQAVIAAQKAEILALWYVITHGCQWR